MKQAKLWNMLIMVLWLVQFAVEALTLFTIWRLDMLPGQYLWLLVAVFLLLWSLTGMLLLIPSRKKNGGSIRRTVGCVMVLLICLGCAAVATVVSDVYDTIHNVINNRPGVEDEKTTRSVYVLADDPAQTLADTKGYTFAVVEGYDAANVEQAIAAIEQILEEEIQISGYASIPAMVDGLYAGEVDAIIVNEVNLALLEEEEAYGDFHTKARLLYEVEIQEQVITPPTSSTEPSGTNPGLAPTEPDITVPSIQEPQDITNTPFLMYIAGSDTRSSWLTKSRNDVNILAVVNPETKQVLLINTPRDYYIANPAGGGAKDKLTHCGNYGVTNSALALAQLYGDRVDYYAQINFRGFETFIDAIGGITVYSDASFTTSDGMYYFSRGENYLDGEEALAFARERYNLAGGDNARGENQMKVVRAVIEKLTSGVTIITNYADILDSLEGMFSTNLSMEEISQLVKMQLSDMASWNILTYSVSGYGDMEVTYSAPGQELYVMWPDQDMVAHATELIDRIIAGEILTQEDLG